MKKLVALVLALVMTLSLCTVTAFATNVTVNIPDELNEYVKVESKDLEENENRFDVCIGDIIVFSGATISYEWAPGETLIVTAKVTPQGEAAGYAFDGWYIDGLKQNDGEFEIPGDITINPSFTTYEPPKNDSELKPLLIAAGITVVAVGTIHTVKAIKNYKAEKAAAAEAAKLAEMPMVRMGDSCDAVMTLQTELNAQGYACGEVDGVFGQNTLNAVMAFQTAKGLTADGVVGAQTWGALL